METETEKKNNVTNSSAPSPSRDAAGRFPREYDIEKLTCWFEELPAQTGILQKMLEWMKEMHYRILDLEAIETTRRSCYTVEGWANLHDMRLSRGQLSDLEDMADAMFGETGLAPAEEPDHIHGRVRTYTDFMLEKVFDAYMASYRP